jgi:phenylpropionate dioxygenase-like ring-hydroxylating dioxygenase large terminal subunit
MIPNQWYVVLDSSQVKDMPVGTTRMGEKLVFWRDANGTVNCLRDQCVHRSVELSIGKVLGNGTLQCPFHGFEYDGSGRVTVIPANGRNTPVPQRFRVHAYPTYEAHDLIWIWWGAEPPQDVAPPRFFDDLDQSFSYGQILDPWPVHYSRAIENQLDVAHLPFVHHNTIGRGNRTLVDGPVVEWVDDDRFFFYVYNRVDDGRPPRRPKEISPDPRRDFRLGFLFPNLWQNYLSADNRVVAAFVPVDDENTQMIVRFYQRAVRLPGLRELVNRLSIPFNRYILHQDRRVVITQPQASWLKIGEPLIQADGPIIAYRRRRQQLIDGAAVSGSAPAPGQ